MALRTMSAVRRHGESQIATRPSATQAMNSAAMIHAERLSVSANVGISAAKVGAAYQSTSVAGIPRLVRRRPPVRANQAP